MSTTSLARVRPPDRDRGRPEPSLFDGLGGEPTLDELLAGAWEGLAAHRTISCPVCGGQMKPEYGVHAQPIEGRCGSCESVLR